jgi:hypothetical protein
MDAGSRNILDYDNSAGIEIAKISNSENPELYAMFPYRPVWMAK